MEISFLGGAREVGKSAVLVENGKKRTLIDYGIKIDSKPTVPLPVQGFVDEVIISHAHLDHSGAVPKLYKISEPNCYTTPPTVPLIDLLIKDSIKIRELEGLEALFTEQHLKRMLRNTETVPYSEEKTIGSGTSIRFENAGHILGASSVKMETPEANIVYTGDIKTIDTQLHNAAYDSYEDVDILITESTYGGEEHPPREQLEKEFADSVKETVEKGGIALIPAFAVGRAQEVITILTEQGFDGKIYLDGMSTDASDIMLNYPDYINNFKGFYKGMKKAEWIEDHGMRKKAMDEPAAIVTTAGMLGGGPVIHYLTNLKKEPGEHGIFLTGYQPEDVPGRELMDSGRFRNEEYDIDFSDYKIEFYDFSAHSDKYELRELAEKLDPELVFVMHGDEENAEALQGWIDSNMQVNSFIPKINESFEIDKYF